MNQIKKEKLSLLKNTIKKLPAQCGVYLMKDINHHIIYIGKARHLKTRVSSYFSQDKSFKNLFLTPKIYNIDYILTETEAEAYLLEAHLIKKHKPRYNIRLKDDKSYPYIRCSLEDSFPRFYMERKVNKKRSLYFGPYTEAYFARRMIQFLNEQFKIRDCSNHFMKSRETPCLTHHIGHCNAPCVNKKIKEDYNKQVKKALSFLRGKGKSILKDMSLKMKELSQEERFEEAARLRDRIKAMELCYSKPVVVSQKKNNNIDVIVFYTQNQDILFQILHVRSGSVTGHRSHYEYNINHSLLTDYLSSFIVQYYLHNLVPDIILLSYEQTKDYEQTKSNFLFSHLEKAIFKIHEKQVFIRTPKSKIEKQLIQMALKNAKTRWVEQQNKRKSLEEGLKEIQKIFHLKHYPERMECFDVSHFQGKNPVASQVVFENGLPKKEDYRKYKISLKKGGDDYSSIKEVLDRRFKHKEYTDPHLLVIDGGKGQLSQAIIALKQAGKETIPIVALAKARVKSDFSAKHITISAEKFFTPNRKNPYTLATHSEAFRILIHLRDEAHRFAINYQRKLSLSAR